MINSNLGITSGFNTESEGYELPISLAAIGAGLTGISDGLPKMDGQTADNEFNHS
jgi:hypothetical protein